MTISIPILIANNSASTAKPTLNEVEKAKRNSPSQSLTTPPVLAFPSSVKAPSQLILTNPLGGGIQQTNLPKLRSSLWKKKIVYHYKI